MVWVYDRTGSLLAAILMHASLTASTFILGPAWVSGSALLVYDVALASAWWLVVAAVALANRGHLTRQPVGVGAAPGRACPSGGLGRDIPMTGSVPIPREDAVARICVTSIVRMISSDP